MGGLVVPLLAERAGSSLLSIWFLWFVWFILFVWFGS
jgi:hypothetical protein